MDSLANTKPLSCALISFQFFLSNDLCDDEEEITDLLFKLLVISGDKLGRSSLHLQKAQHGLTVAHVLLFHGAPNNEALTQGVTRDELFEVTSLDHDTVLLDHNNLRFDTDKILFVSDFRDRHQAAKEDTQLINTHVTK